MSRQSGKQHVKIFIITEIDCGVFDGQGVSDDVLLFDFLPKFNVLSTSYSRGPDYVWGSSLEEKIKNLLDPSGQTPIRVHIELVREVVPRPASPGGDPV